MSAWLDPWVHKPEGAKGTTRALLWWISVSVLTERASDTANIGWCTASEEKLADALGVARSTVQVALSKLQELKLIETEDITSRRGTWQRRRPHPRLEAEWKLANPSKVKGRPAQSWVQPLQETHVVVDEVMPWDDTECPASPDTQTTGEDDAKSP